MDKYETTLLVGAGGNCAVEAFYLNRVLSACEAARPSVFSAGARVQCLPDGEEGLLAFKGGDSCAAVAADLRTIVAEATGPVDPADQDIGCLQGYFTDASADCSVTAAALNGAIAAFADGLFWTCELTTPTTSPTSTATSTATSSPTSSAIASDMTGSLQVTPLALPLSAAQGVRTGSRRGATWHSLR